MTNYTIEKTGRDSICFHFRVPPAELRARSKTHISQFDAPARAAMVRTAMESLISEACRKTSLEYPDILYFKPVVTVTQNLPGRDLIFSANIQIRPVCRLCDYRSIRLTPEDRARVEKALADIPADEQADTRLYLLQAALIGHIADKSSIEIPEDMVNERAVSMAREFKRRIEMDDDSLDNYYRATGTDEKQMLAGFAADAREQIRTRLTLQSIAQAEGLEATQADYDEEVRHLSVRYPLSLEQIRALLEAGEGARLRQDIAVSKAANFIGECVTEQIA